jgi:hypothetical protein
VAVPGDQIVKKEIIAAHQPYNLSGPLFHVQLDAVFPAQHAAGFIIRRFCVDQGAVVVKNDSVKWGCVHCLLFHFAGDSTGNCTIKPVIKKFDPADPLINLSGLDACNRPSL